MRTMKIEIEMNEVQAERSVQCTTPTAQRNENQMNWMERAMRARRKEKSDNLWIILPRKIFAFVCEFKRSLVIAYDTACVPLFYTRRQHWGRREVQQ